MGLRGLDPFVNDPPGRRNNLYKDGFIPTTPSFNDSYVQDLDGTMPTDTLCAEAISTGPGLANACLGVHRMRADIVPERRIQFDLNVEKARSILERKNSGFLGFNFSDKSPIWGVIISIISFIFIMNLAKR